MTTTTHFIEIGTEGTEDRIKNLEGVQIDAIISATDRKSLQTAGKAQEILKRRILIYAEANLNYKEDVSELLLERQVPRVHQLLTREYLRKTILIISHKEIIDRLVAKLYQVSIEELRRMRGPLGQYHCLQTITD